MKWLLLGALLAAGDQDCDGGTKVNDRVSRNHDVEAGATCWTVGGENPAIYCIPDSQLRWDGGQL